MKAKYIFRGFGLGIIITAVIMGAYTRKSVADARVKVLKEYGIGEEAKLVESIVDEGSDKNGKSDGTVEVIPFGSEATPQPTATDSEPETKIQQETTVQPEAKAETDMPKEPETPKEPQKETEVPKQAETPKQIVVEPEDDDNKITIVITKGDDSGTVARKLRNAGLIESAAEFDAFLIQHGYDKKINTGTKTLNSGASWQELAEKITR